MSASRFAGLSALLRTPDGTNVPLDVIADVLRRQRDASRSVAGTDPKAPPCLSEREESVVLHRLKQQRIYAIRAREDPYATGTDGFGGFLDRPAEWDLGVFQESLKRGVEQVVRSTRLDESTSSPTSSPSSNVKRSPASSEHPSRSPSLYAKQNDRVFRIVTALQAAYVEISNTTMEQGLKRPHVTNPPVSSNQESLPPTMRRSKSKASLGSKQNHSPSQGYSMPSASGRSPNVQSPPSSHQFDSPYDATSFPQSFDASHAYVSPAPALDYEATDDSMLSNQMNELNHASSFLDTSDPSGNESGEGQSRARQAAEALKSKVPFRSNSISGLKWAKSLNRKKSKKKLTRTISNPQLISTTQRLDHAVDIANLPDNFQGARPPGLHNTHEPASDASPALSSSKISSGDDTELTPELAQQSFPGATVQASAPRLPQSAPVNPPSSVPLTNRRSLSSGAPRMHGRQDSFGRQEYGRQEPLIYQEPLAHQEPLGRQETLGRRDTLGRREALGRQEPQKFSAAPSVSNEHQGKQEQTSSFVPASDSSPQGTKTSSYASASSSVTGHATSTAAPLQMLGQRVEDPSTKPGFSVEPQSKVEYNAPTSGSYTAWSAPQEIPTTRIPGGLNFAENFTSPTGTGLPTNQPAQAEDQDAQSATPVAEPALANASVTESTPARNSLGDSSWTGARRPNMGDKLQELLSRMDNNLDLSSAPEPSQTSSAPEPRESIQAPKEVPQATPFTSARNSDLYGDIITFPGDDNESHADDSGAESRMPGSLDIPLYGTAATSTPPRQTESNRARESTASYTSKVTPLKSYASFYDMYSGTSTYGSHLDLADRPVSGAESPAIKKAETQRTESAVTQPAVSASQYPGAALAGRDRMTFGLGAPQSGDNPVWDVIAGLNDRSSLYSDAGQKGQRMSDMSILARFAPPQQNESLEAPSDNRPFNEDERAFFKGAKSAPVHDFESSNEALRTLEPSSASQIKTPLAGSQQDESNEQGTPTQVVYYDDEDLIPIMDQIAKGNNSARIELRRRSTLRTFPSTSTAPTQDNHVQGEDLRDLGEDAHQSKVEQSIYSLLNPKFYGLGTGRET